MILYTYFILFLISDIQRIYTIPIEEEGTNKEIRTFSRSKRYLGLNKRYKINRRYQECIAPGDAPGHCKHTTFCALDVMGSSRGSLDYFCVIANAHVGVCCPDDIVLSSLSGSRIVMDLPAGGEDYDDESIDLETTHSGCGFTAAYRQPVEGSFVFDSRTREWPWLAAIYKPEGDSLLNYCGGAVITDQHILTAAHCVNGMTANEIRVRLGEYDFRRPNETRFRDFGLTAIIAHSEFDPATYFNDIAILVLEKPTTFDTYIWPVCLPPLNGSYVNHTAYVAGWGQQYYAGPTSEVLIEVAIPIWSLEMCVEVFTQRITENNICAAGYEGGKDSCLGDSGGPLLYKLQNERWIIIGIVSWGIGCGNRNQPGIYTRVDKFIPWIIKNTITTKIVPRY